VVVELVVVGSEVVGLVAGSQCWRG
jgi:hypothetical protein